MSDETRALTTFADIAIDATFEGVAGQLAPTSRRVYAQDLKAFVSWLNEQAVLHISEIGLAHVAQFKDRFGLEPYRGESSDTFTAVGDISGLFIMVKIGRIWFPTKTDAAPVAPVEVTVEGAKEQRYHVSPYPYEIDVVAKTSRR